MKKLLILLVILVLGIDLYLFLKPEKVEIPESVNTEVETQEEFSPCENCKG